MRPVPLINEEIPEGRNDALLGVADEGEGNRVSVQRGLELTPVMLVLDEAIVLVVNAVRARSAL